MPVHPPEIEIKIGMSHLVKAVKEFNEVLYFSAELFASSFAEGLAEGLQSSLLAERTEELLMAGYSPVRKGIDPRKEGKSLWLTIEPNSFVDVVALVDTDEIISHEQCAIWREDGINAVWPYTGSEDPSHDLGITKTYRSYLPVLLDGDQKIWSLSKTVEKQLWDIAESSTGGLKGQMIRVKREGSGLSTRYTIIPRGKRVDVSKESEVDIISNLGPLTSDDAKKMLEEKFELPYAAIVKKIGGKLKEKEEGKKSKKEEIDDFEELEAGE
jgi:hypothetical protein